jgi:hypothetical protein
VFCFPGALADGTHNVDASISGEHATWSFITTTPPAPPVVVPPAAFDNLSCTTGSSCHIHGAAYQTDVAMGPKCAMCHSAGFAPKHGLTPSAASVGTAHDALVAYINGSTSKSCTACHGSDVMGVATKVAGPPVSYTVPNVGGTTEHNGCSCHQYGEAESLKACSDCHYGAYGDIHGWNKNTQKVSGHNTTTYGTVGARTDFSSLGITDTVGAAPAAQFPLTVNNTFKAGYSWNSVITCEDCHTGLAANEPAGPHGGFDFSATAGIDPAYNGEFATASLWGGTYTVGASSMANATTLTIGPFSTGIAQWTPAGGESEDLKDYQVIQPDMSTAASTKFVAGTATVSNGSVICVKCHDLYDATKNTGFKGWGNYAHEHHSADTGSFKMNFGKFEVGNGGGIASQTVVAESAAAAMAQVTGATKNKQITAPSLGREVAGACRNCHIAIPHGWKRPKLIVYSNMSEPSPGYRAGLGLPAAGDVAPYNIGPAVYEGEALNGTNIGSGQMNGLASGIVHVQEAQTLLDGSTYTTAGTLPSQLLVENEDYPALVELNRNPLNGFTGDEYVNWSSSQCNACGHHSTTSFNNPTATQPAITWNSRENNWVGTKPAHGAWK